jgi:hypothetical protein
MSDVTLGSMARINHGLSSKYLTPDLLQSYKDFIDSLETAMMTAVYDLTFNNCIITQNCNVVLTPDQQVNGYDESVFFLLESAIIHFCKLHDVSVDMVRTGGPNANVAVTIDMKITHNYSIS